MKKETFIKSIILLIYYCAIVFIHMSFENYKYQIIKMEINFWEIIFLLLPLVILFIPYFKIKKIFIIPTVIVLFITYINSSFYFTFNPYYESYTNDINNYMDIDDIPNFSNKICTIFPDSVNENDEYQYFYAKPRQFGGNGYHNSLIYLKHNVENIQPYLGHFEQTGFEIGVFQDYSYYTLGELLQYPHEQMYIYINEDSQIITYLYITHPVLTEDVELYNQRILNVICREDSYCLDYDDIHSLFE